VKKILTKISEGILNLYMEYMKKRGRPVFSKKEEKILSNLNPGREPKNVIREYYTEKIYNTLLAALIAILVITLASINILLNPKLQKGNLIYRKGYGEGSESLTLDVQSDKYRYGEVLVSISEKKLNSNEYEKMMEQVKEILKSSILGDNTSLEHIDRDMNLPSSIDGYPVSIRWASSNYDLLRADGSLGQVEADIKGEDIILTAYIGYDDMLENLEISARIYPAYKSEDEERLYRLNQAINEADKLDESSEYVILPESIDGSELTWKERNLFSIPLMVFIAFVAIFALWKGMDQDLDKKNEERKELLLIQYSEIVSKLQVLLSAGLTIRGSLERMSNEYLYLLQNGGKKKAAYEELVLSMKKLKDGMDEADCYRYFGERCSLICYRKLTSLLIQNMRKGNKGLLLALESESKLAFEERKMAVKRKGEEAGTKLIFPMMIMLFIVMILIMIPAYMSFGGM